MRQADAETSKDGLLSWQGLSIAAVVLLAVLAWLVLQLRKSRRREVARHERLAEILAPQRLEELPAGRERVVGVVLRGRVEAQDTMTSPFADRPCVAYRLRVFGPGVDDVGLRVFERCVLDQTRALEFGLAVEGGTISVRPGPNPIVLSATESHRQDYEDAAATALRTKFLELGFTLEGDGAFEVREDVVLAGAEVRVKGDLHQTDATAREMRPSSSGELLIASGPLAIIAARLHTERDVKLSTLVGDP